MRDRVGAVLWSLLLVGCGSNPVARPFAGQPPGLPPAEDREEASLETEAGRRKESAGQVTFTGLERPELAAIRVIPEEGKGLFQPENRTYDQVDGFWWRGEKELWFKIPDWSEAWVGASPEGAAREVSRGDLKIFVRTNRLLGMMGALGVAQARPSWVPNEGSTRSPVPRPKEFEK